ncbi:NUDIX domain-containing protein [Paenibacillus sp. ISL-20]|uniref:NUDIX domain-containing protein n=1 Tax=Paenibacillus sp. ISL-20 TaxID=2819163 RepID=UPI001BE59B39|nr:NUDIX domain-containing protein [Paenibacillus sp. ISL-20]MBT2764078.1 NUDIX domain-containing protein [Paenibacillus sp. ISL-20]
MIRNTVRALIIQDEMLLTIKKERPDVGVYYALPGGAQELDETLEQTLKRECLEELGVDLLDCKLVCVREYISKNHEYSNIMKEVHAVDFIYECNINPISNQLSSSQADVGQIGIEWLPINEILQAITQSNELLKPYKFPRVTEYFIKEYFIDQITEPYRGEIFVS